MTHKNTFMGIKNLEQITKRDFMGHKICMKRKVTLYDQGKSINIIYRFEFIINFPQKYFPINYP